MNLQGSQPTAIQMQQNELHTSIVVTFSARSIAALFINHRVFVGTLEAGDGECLTLATLWAFSPIAYNNTDALIPPHSVQLHTSSYSSSLLAIHIHKSRNPGYENMLVRSAQLVYFVIITGTQHNLRIISLRLIYEWETIRNYLNVEYEHFWDQNE